jgi:carbon-monoxide dehydrogenase large subunit
MYVERAGGMWESAQVSAEPNGRVVVRSGSNPHGQGHETTFAQIAADRLGVEMSDVVLQFGDSAVVPRGIGTFASRSVAMGGSALVLAIDKLLDAARPIAAQVLDAPLDDVSWEGGAFSDGAGRSVSFKDVAAAAYQPARLPPGAEVGLEASARFSSPQVFSSGAYAAVVEIERATGVLRVLRIAAVDDAGNIVNPLLAEGQVIGGAVQGLGEALVEEAIHDENGQFVTASFLDYSLMTAAEVPPIRAEFIETPSPFNPLGAKGIGEGGAIGTPAAVASAVADALGGIDLDPPYTGERLWRALRSQEDSA